MRSIAWLAALGLALAACGRQAADAEIPPRWTGDAPGAIHASEHGPLAVQELVVGLEHPWGLAFLPDGRMLVTERPGRLRRIGDGRVSPPIGGLPRLFAEGQAGLLDVALSPGFQDDRLVYLAYAEPNLRGNKAGTAVARGRLEGDRLEGVEVVYRQQPRLSSGTHVGARLVFADDGTLFVTQGDNRVAADMAQQLDVLPGKLVRINPDGTVPPDNPFVGTPGARPEIWSYGHRNIQGAALHPVTRRLWTSEHGPLGGDELNLAQVGGNHGWPRVTRGLGYDGEPVPGSVGTGVPGMVEPHHWWARSPGLSGMAFYTAGLIPQWRGSVLLGALASRELIRLELDGDRIIAEERLLGERGERIRDVRQGPDGAVYVLVDAPNGKLLRISPGTADLLAR